MCFTNQGSNNELGLDLPKDFGKFTNKNILFTGAGFSKDFGGLLAEEITYQIYNNESISRHIKNLMIEKDGNYELVYDLTEEDEVVSLNNVLVNIFKDMDIRIMQHAGKRYSNWNDFIDLFYNEEKYNFIVTLNQDLLLERDFISRGVIRQSRNNSPANYTVDKADEYSRLNFPYVDYSIRRVIVEQFNSKTNYALQYQNDYHFADLIQKVNEKKDKKPNMGVVNYLKLHGSSSWHDDLGRTILIAGENKDEKVSKSKELHLNMELFGKLCGLKKLNLVVIGYRFHDNHINKQIIKAVRGGARLYIVSPNSLREFSCEIKKLLNDDSEVILSALENYFNSKFMDFLSSDNFKTLKKSISP